jgi:phosphoglycerate dehydrogenase-like enzyme
MIPMDDINVLITMPFPEDIMEKLSSISPALVFHQREARRGEEIVDAVAEVDVLYTFQALPEPTEAPRLRWVQMHSAGVDMVLDHPLYADSEVMFTTTSGIHGIPMAEYTLGMMLAFSHRMPRMFEDKAGHTWTPTRWDRFVPDELFGATVGLVGYGSIGRQVARLARAFGMKVLALKRDVRSLEEQGYVIAETGDPSGEIPDRFYPPQALHSFLAECDYVVVTVPLYGETRHLIDGKALDAMRSNAVLINVARGDIIDEAALIEALRKEQIRGAALDVFAEEPLLESSALWDLPNVLISPHVSGFTPHYDARATDVFAENLRRFISGEPLLNLVDKARHY